MPSGVALDANDNLLIADTGNNRIVEIDDPLENFTISRVIGQGPADNFESGERNYPDGIADASGMAAPVALGFDSQGNLYASDEQNSRVLEFTFPFPTGTSLVRAAAVYGQGTTGENFAGNTCHDGGTGRPINSATLCNPRGVAIDAVGDLYVGDSANDRVLRFPHAFVGFIPVPAARTTARGAKLQVQPKVIHFGRVTSITPRTFTITSTGNQPLIGFVLTTNPLLFTVSEGAIFHWRARRAPW